MSDQILNGFLAEHFDRRRILALPIPSLLYEGDGFALPHALILPQYEEIVSRLRIVSTPENQSQLQDKYPGEWFKSACTGVSLDKVISHPIILVAMQFDWSRIGIVPYHNYTMFVLQEAQELAQSALDIIRFDLCGITRRHSILGTPGMLNTRENFAVGIFYSNDSDHEGHMFAGQTGNDMLVPPGLGLEVDCHYTPTQIPEGDVGNTIRHALSWYRIALNASSCTQQFILLFSLLELLSSPDAYTKSKSVRQAVGLHVAKDKGEYIAVCQTFDRYAGIGKDKEPGLRTRIVHMGKRIEDLLETQKDIDAVLSEMEKWAVAMITHLIRLADQGWTAVESFRQDRKRMLGV